MFFDQYYIIFVVPALIIAALAQMNVSSAFNKYSRLQNRRGMTGYDIARRILDDHGLRHVKIERVAGSLTDHFDPTKMSVRLSDTVYSSTSVAAIGVAAHECGHAIQHNEGYLPVRLRTAIVPITQIGSTLAWPIAIIGIFSGFELFISVGIWLFIGVVIFQLVTLPVEFDASARALKTIKEDNVLEGAEYSGAKRMLQAAALTYVGALIMAIANLLRLLALANRRND